MAQQQSSTQGSTQNHEALARVVALHQRVTKDGETYCGHCQAPNQSGTPTGLDWPCPTISAITGQPSLT